MDYKCNKPQEIEQKIQVQRPKRKYKYEEFEDYAGEDLLKEIISAILPLALARTWEKTMSFGSAKPWVGTERISQRAQVTQRKIQQDLKDLQDLGLLEVKIGYETTVNNGQITEYRAEYKDFSKLYDLAHEYNMWRKSRGYLIYQPTFADCMRLREKHELFLKLQEDREYHKDLQENEPETLNEILDGEWHYKYLLKFHNYRRLLLQKLKGTSEKSLGGARTHNGHLLRKTKNSDLVSTPYEAILNSNIDSMLDSNLTQEKSSVTQVSPLTRRDECEYPHDEGGTHEDFTMGSGKGANSAEYSFEIPPRGNISQREVEPKVQRNGPRTAKEITAQQKGKALIEAVLNEEDRKAHTPKQERRNKWLESEELRKEHKGIVNMYSHIADRLNDQNPKSTETLLAKMQKESGMSEEEFIMHVDYARQKVCSIPQDKIRKRGADGKPNRTPLFIQILKDALKRGIAACQEDDRHADEVRNMFKVVEQEKAEVSAELDARDQALAGMENDPEVQSMLYQAAVQSAARQDEIEAGMKAAEPEPAPPVLDGWRDQLEAKAKEIKATTGLNAYVGGECEECGCKIKIRVGWTPVCGWCKPHESWSDETRAQVLNAIREVYEVA